MGDCVPNRTGPAADRQASREQLQMVTQVLPFDRAGAGVQGGGPARRRERPRGAWAWLPLRTRADLLLLSEQVDFAVQLSGDRD